MEASKFVLICFTLFVAYVVAQPGSDCGSNVRQIYPETQGFAHADQRANYTVTPHSSSFSNIGPSQGFNKGVCLAGNPAPQKIYWFKWEPTADASVIYEITHPNNGYTWNARLLVVSQAPTAPSCDTYNTGPGSLNVGTDWTCETRIKDACQGYPSEPDIYNVKAGKVYFILIDSQNTSATSLSLTIVKQNVLFYEGFESVAGGSLPAGWTNTSTSTFGGWRIDTLANADSKDLNFSAIDTAPVGGVGTKILFLNPFRNGPYSRDNCTATNFKYCNHSINAITTSAFNLSGVSNAHLSFETFFYAKNPYAVTLQIAGRVYASYNGNNWTKVADLTSVVDYMWYVETADLQAFVGQPVVYLRFVYNALVDGPIYGWVINNVQVTPISEYDLCEDGFDCTYHTCSTIFPNFGCISHNNDSYCEGVSVDCMSNKCNITGTGVDAESGCVFTPIPDYCDDSLDCTDEVCDSKDGCKYTEYNSRCDDGKGCTVNYCFGKENARFGEAGADGCAFIQQCDDKVDCTVDTCENATMGGDKCLHTVNFQYCEDFIDCTYELACDPEQAGYDDKTGCIRIPMHEWCDDHDACTIDTCDFSLNMSDSCTHTNVTCDDCLHCTVDYCDDGECIHDPQNDQCDDQFDCTVDICDESLGKCTNNPNDTYCAYFGDLCSIHYCRPWAASDSSGCVSFPKVCDDEIACSEDACDELTGDCVFTANHTKCDAGLECTDDLCDLNLGKCTNKPNSANCKDEDSCSIDFCGYDGNCDSYIMDCVDEVACSDDWCEDGECQHYFNNTHCDDKFDCTVDICDENLGKCSNIPSDAYCTEIGNKCFHHFCNIESSSDVSGCYSVPKDCSDDIACTYDWCDELTGECMHDANDTMCDDGHWCTVDVCDITLGRCTNFGDDSRCDDKNVCTEKDICGCDGECRYDDLYCNDQIWCTLDYCDPEVEGGCVFVANDTICDDGNACTDDYCDVELGRCVNTPFDSWCPGRSTCETGTCSLELGGCVYESHDDWCDDLVGCTLDQCNGPAGCSNYQRDSLCDDGIGCTQDTCNATGCLYEPMDNWCYDAHTCTNNICSETEDCIIDFQHDNCDDSINCTKDWCDEEGCHNVAQHSWCSDGVTCTDDYCVPDDKDGNWCHNIAEERHCEDGFDCSEHTCDFDLGCVTNYTMCPWYDLGKDDQICIECMSSSGQIDQLHYKDGTGAMSFKTRNVDSGDLEYNMVLLPSNSVILGGDQDGTPVSTSDGLVINDAFRLVPLPRGETEPDCNEIRRGTFIVVEEQYECGPSTCHRDVVKVCKKEQDYKWVELSNSMMPSDEQEQI